jgi:hypothetical protein
MGEQEVYENVDFAAKEDLLRWLDLDYTQVNTAHHLRNKVRLSQSIKDDIRSGEKISWEEAGKCCTVYSKSAGILCAWGGRGKFMNGGMPIACQRHLWSCGEKCISALKACCSFEAGLSCPGPIF